MNVVTLQKLDWWLGVFLCLALNPNASDMLPLRRWSSERYAELAGQAALGQLLVTTDIGTAHFATLTPIRVVTRFGPEIPALFAARSGRYTALWAGIACSPCVNAFNNRQSPCRNNLCVQEITVDQVFAAMCGAYDENQAARQA